MREIRKISLANKRVACCLLAAMAFASIVTRTAAAQNLGRDNVEIRVLSSKPYLVSGETALVQITVPHHAELSQLTVLVNGQEITSSLHYVDNTLTGVIKVLSQGQNKITVAGPDGSTLNQLLITDYSIKGPMISGPQQEPFICQTQEFVLPNGTTLGAPLHKQCSAKTTVQYVYKSTTTNGFVSLPNPSSLPADVAQTTTLLGVTVPYVVRVEAGTIDRAIYQIAILNDPTVRPHPTPLDPPGGWNKRLIWSHGGGCPPGWYIQGNTTGPVLDDLHLSQGFALASTSFNAPDQACNAVLSAESTIMTKARFIEEFGVPLYTMSIGCSGGSYDSELLADAHPGLYDGIIISCIFPDPISIATSGLDARLLLNYFTNTAPDALSSAQQLAVAGFGEYAQIPVAAVTADRTDPIQNLPPIPGLPPIYAASPTGADWSPDVPASLRYDPNTNPRGARPTVWDADRNVYGIDPETGFALRPYDNVGIQYGLAALNTGQITATQFLDLNERIGGYDIDDNYITSRTVGDRAAMRRAYEGDLILSGGGGLQSLPVLGWNEIYSDTDPAGEYHLHYHMFEMRARVLQANGTADNVVLWSAGVPIGALIGEPLYPAPTPAQTALLTTLSEKTTSAMDRWLTAIMNDNSGGALASKVVRDKPDDVVDGCWTVATSPKFIAETQFYGGPGTSRCNTLYPAFSWPRHVAGIPLENNIFKCQLKPIDSSDYNIQFSSAEMQRLRNIYPGGVCNWSKPGVEQRPVVVDASFGPSPTNQLFNVLTGKEHVPSP